MSSEQTKAEGRYRRGGPPLMLAVDRRSGVPIFRQIYGSIREAIMSGRFAGGMRLPASRTLARDLAVARTTVVLAYEQLLAEGYLRGRGSAGTYVSALTLPKSAVRRNDKEAAIAPSADDHRDVLPFSSTPPRPFRVGVPALDLFPSALWARLHSRRARASTSEFLRYGLGTGYQPLRRAIAEYVAASRGVRASVEQVILVRGAQQGIDITARLLLRPGDKVWFEDPGFVIFRRLFDFVGANVVPVPLDDEGMQVTAGIRRAADARLAYVAPSNQFPLGCTLSLERRLALLAWAERTRSWIIEDDYDSEFRYPGPPLASLQGLDRNDRVIYIGTFSKTVFPALRLGYLIVPPELIERFSVGRNAVDHIAPTLEQAVLTDFIEEGHFTRHLRHMRNAYAERQAALLAGAARELAGLMTVQPADAGMHAIGWLDRQDVDDRAVSRRAIEMGLDTWGLSACCQRATLPPALLLGFAAVRPSAMAPALKLLRRVLGS